jgi:hypothetical protein
MAVTLRERPLVTGKDAERFLERVRRNNELMRQRRQNRKSKDIRNESSSHVRAHC